jgi:hypothetical protein
LTDKPEKPSVQDFIKANADWTKIFQPEEIGSLVNALVNKMGGHVLINEKTNIHAVCLPIKGGRYDGGFSLGAAPNIMDAAWGSLAGLADDASDAIVCETLEQAKTDSKKQIKAFMEFAKTCGKERKIIRRGDE